MEETKNNALQQNMKYILILIGIVAIALSYFMGFSKYKTDISDIEDEISSLETRYNELKTKEQKRKQYEEDKEKIKEEYEALLAQFDAGLSTKRIIMDCHNIASSIGLSFESLSLTEAKSSYVFGTEKKDGKATKKDDIASYDMVASSRTYSIQATGTYLDIKEMLNQIMSDKAKRRVPTTISFSFDSTLNTVTCKVGVTEYAVMSKNRQESVSQIPTYNAGIDNIFFTSLIKNADVTP